MMIEGQEVFHINLFAKLLDSENVTVDDLVDFLATYN